MRNNTKSRIPPFPVANCSLNPSAEIIAYFEKLSDEDGYCYAVDIGRVTPHEMGRCVMAMSAIRGGFKALREWGFPEFAEKVLKFEQQLSTKSKRPGRRPKPPSVEDFALAVIVLDSQRSALDIARELFKDSLGRMFANSMEALAKKIERIRVNANKYPDFLQTQYIASFKKLFEDSHGIPLRARDTSPATEIDRVSVQNKMIIELLSKE